MLRKKLPASEVIIYNYDVKSQELRLVHRGDEIPAAYRGYQKLWRLTDKHRNTETFIISI